MRDHYDFSQGRRGAVLKTTREPVAMRLDPDIIQWFKSQVNKGGNYQNLMNEALRQHIRQQDRPQGNTLHSVTREERYAAG